MRLDAIVARVAAEQHGVIATRQLLEIGLHRRAIARRTQSGRLHRLHRGVYAVGHVPGTPLMRAAAALLACGDGAVLVLLSAAALWEMTASWPTAVQVAGTRTGGHRGVRPHRMRLPSADVTVRRGLRVTTPARTLVDLAGIVSGRRLTRMVHDARRAGLVTLDALRAQVEGSRGRPTTALRAVLDHPTTPTRSGLEDRFLAFLRRHALTLPEVNQRAAGHEVDVLWRDQRLVAELDGVDYHDDLAAFERDRERDADLLAAGFRVIRITAHRLDTQPEREARRLRRLLGP